MAEEESRGNGLFFIGQGFGEKCLEGLVDIDFPLIRQFHKRQGGGQRFGQGGEIKNRFPFHGELFRNQGEKSCLFKKKDFTSPGDQEHGPWKDALNRPLLQQPF